MSTLAGVLLGTTLAGGPAPALAPPAVAVELDWRAPRGCPAAARVEATIDRLVGPRAPSSTSGEPAARVQAVVHAEPEGFRLELHTRHGGASEHRTLAAPRCDALADAAALIVAVALQPVEAAATVIALESVDPPPRSVSLPPPRTPAIPPPSAVASRSKPSPATAAEPGLVVTADAAPARRRGLGGALAVAVGPGIGLLPGVAAQLTAALALRGRRWRAEAAGAYWFPRNAGPPAEPTIEVGLATGALRGCYVPSPRRLELPLCAGVEAGAMTGEGRGAGVLPRRTRALFVAAQAGPGIVVPLGAWTALRVSVDALVALRQPGFDLTIDGDRTELYRAPAVGARAAVGLELRWP